MVQDMRAHLERMNDFQGEFQKGKRITGHPDRQLIFFKQNIAKVITGLERLLAAGSGRDTGRRVARCRGSSGSRSRGIQRRE